MLCNCRYTVAETVWAFHPTSLVALMGTCDGPTRRRRVETAIALVAKNRFQLLTRRHSMSVHRRVSRREDGIQLSKLDRIIHETKLAIPPHLACATYKSAERATCETAADTDALHSQSSGFSHV